MTNLPEHVPAVPAPRGDRLSPLLEAAILDASDRLPTLAGDTEALAFGIVNLDSLIGQLKTLRDEAAILAFESLPRTEAREGARRQKVAIDGLGVVEPVHATSSWKNWDKRRMLLAAVGRAVDAGTVNHPNDVVDVVLEVASVGGGKSNVKEGTGLAKYGLERGSFARSEYGKPSVRIIK